MALLFGGSSYLKKAFTLAAATPYYMIAWCNFTSPLTDGVIMGIGSSTAGKQSSYILSITSGKAQFKVTTSAGTTITAISTVTITAGAWFHIIGLITSTSARSVTVNGVLTAGSGNGGGLNTDFGTMGVGNAPANGVWGTAIKATLAFPAFWIGGPIDTSALVLGAYPTLIVPRLISSCSDLIGVSPEPDRCNGTPWTLVGSPTVAANPLIYH